MIYPTLQTTLPAPSGTFGFANMMASLEALQHGPPMQGLLRVAMPCGFFDIVADNPIDA